MIKKPHFSFTETLYDGTPVVVTFTVIDADPDVGIPRPCIDEFSITNEEDEPIEIGTADVERLHDKANARIDDYLLSCFDPDDEKRHD